MFPVGQIGSKYIVVSVVRARCGPNKILDWSRSGRYMAEFGQPNHQSLGQRNQQMLSAIVSRILKFLFKDFLNIFQVFVSLTAMSDSTIIQSLK